MDWKLNFKAENWIKTRVNSRRDECLTRGRDELADTAGALNPVPSFLADTV